MMMVFPVSHWGTGLQASPSFVAPLANTLIPTVALGGYSIAFARASIAYVADWENILRLCKSDEARFTGARRVQNLLVKTEALNDAAWTKVNASITTGVSDPLGGTTAFTMTATGANAELYQQFTGLSTSQTRCSSVWMRRRTGTGQIQLTAKGTGRVITSSVTSSWQRLAVTDAADATSYFDVFLPVSGDAVDLWHPQHEDVTGQSNTNPGEYVSASVLSSPFNGANVDTVKYFSTLNGNTVSSFVVTEATGAAINTTNGASTATCDSTGPFGILIEENRTNIAANTEAFDNAYWSKFRATITADSTASPNGIKTADTLVEDNTTGNHGFARAFTKSATPITYTLSAYVKKSGRDWCFLSGDDGTVIFGGYFNVNTGVTGGIVSGNFTNCSTTISPAANGFYRLTFTGTSNSTTTIDAYVMSATADGTNSFAGSNSAALFVWGLQLEVGSFASSYAPNGTARPYDGFTYSPFAGNASATNGTAYAEAKTEWATSNGTVPLVSFGIAASTLYPLYSSTEAATVIRTNDGTNNVGKTGIASMNTAPRKVAASWIGATLAVTGAGAVPATGTFDGNMGITAIGIGNPTTGTGTVWSGNIRNVKMWTVAATPLQLKTLTT